MQCVAVPVFTPVSSSFNFQLSRIGSAYAVGYFYSALELLTVPEFTQCRSSKLRLTGPSFMGEGCPFADVAQAARIIAPLRTTLTLCMHAAIT